MIYYGGLTYGRTSFDYDADAWQLAPEYTERDLRLADKGSLTSYAVAKHWYDRLQAPHKRFVTFANSAHMAMLEQPGQYLDSLVRLVRRTAEN